MHDKEKLSMYVDITKITIIICWVSLIGFWLLKIFGSNFFEIMVENENFLRFSDLIQNTWLKYVVSFITITIANYLMLAAISETLYFNGVKLVIVLCITTSMWAVANFVPIMLIQMYYGYVVILAYSAIIQKGIKKLYGVLAILFELAFTIISLITRSLELTLIDNYLILLILSIDMYIMTLLYYLYTNLNKIKKENSYGTHLGTRISV